MEARVLQMSGEIGGREAEHPGLGGRRVPCAHLRPSPTASCWELVNTWCGLGTLTAHLRQRGQVPPDGEGAARVLEDWLRAPPPERGSYQPCPASLSALPASVALLAEDGHLVSLAEGLEEGPSTAPSVASPPLQERGTYVLMQIISKWSPRSALPAVTLEYKKRQGHPCPAEPPAWPGPSPVLPSNALS